MKKRFLSILCCLCILFSALPAQMVGAATETGILSSLAARASIPLKSFKLNKTTFSLDKGKSYTLKVSSYSPSNTTSNKKISFKRSNTKIATVSVKGVVTAVNPGKATITATVAGKTAKATVTVKSYPLFSFKLNRMTLNLTANAKFALNVVSYTPANTTSSKAATWQTSNKAVAVVDSKGVVRGISKGSAIITCRVAGKIQTCRVTVGASLSSFTLNSRSISLDKGQSATLKVTSYTPANTTSDRTATWKSSNTKIATVSSKGVVTAVNPGKATLTVTVAGKTQQCTVTVKSYPLVSFKLKQSSLQLSPGKSQAIQVASYNPANTTSSKTASWKSVDEDIATVDPKGIVRGVSNGQTAIICIVAGKMQTCKVTVSSPLASFTLNKSRIALNKGGKYTLSVSAYKPADTTSNKTASWTSSNVKIATVDAKGIVRAIAPGSAVVTCTVAGKTQSCTITVNQLLLNSIAITKNPTKLSYLHGERFNPSGMVVTASYNNGSSKAVTGYTVSPNRAFRVGDSSASISYREGAVTKTATLKLTIKSPEVKVSGITLDRSSIKMEVNDGSNTLQAAITPANATNKKLVWSSSNNSIATVDENGKITGKSFGEVVITAKAVSGVSASCTVYIHQNRVQLPNGNYCFKKYGTDKALDVAGGSSASGSNVAIYPYNGSGAQVWRIDNFNTAASMIRLYPQCAPSLVLDAQGYYPVPLYNTIQIYTADSWQTQEWYLSRLYNGSHAIVSNLQHHAVSADNNSANQDVYFGPFDTTSLDVMWTVEAINPPQESTRDAWIVNTDSLGLNCRDNPNGNNIGGFNEGQQITVIGNIQNGWYKVKGNDRSTGAEIQGWSHGDYISFEKPSQNDFIWPASGGHLIYVLDYYYGKTSGGVHPTYGNGSTKGSVDIAVTGNALSTLPGTVQKVAAGYNGGWGNYVLVKHTNGMYSFYAHLASISVSQGQSVSAGQILGVIGTTGNSTGVHLHFEILDNAQNTVYTLDYLKDKYKKQLVFDGDIVTGGSNNAGMREWIRSNYDYRNGKWYSK